VRLGNQYCEINEKQSPARAENANAPTHFWRQAGLISNYFAIAKKFYIFSAVTKREQGESGMKVEHGVIFCIPLFMDRNDWKLKTKLSDNDLDKKFAFGRVIETK